MIEWTSPVLALVPAAIAVGAVSLGRSGRYDPSLGLTAATASTLAWGPRIRGLLRAMALVSLALALAGPVVPRVTAPPAVSGLAVVVALDVSESMREEGLADGSRLDAATAELERFVAMREHDLVGLVTFARDAVVRVPPTLDRAPLLEALRRAEDEVPGDGTALGTAIAHAANRLRGVDVRSRVVVVVTDGESNAGAVDPITAARAASSLGQRLYVVGLGGQALETLDEVARSGGGRSYRVEDREALDQAYREIDGLERARIEPVAASVVTVPLARIFLLAAAMLLFTETLLGAVRPGGVP